MTTTRRTRTAAAATTTARRRSGPTRARASRTPSRAPSTPTTRATPRTRRGRRPAAATRAPCCPSRTRTSSCRARRPRRPRGRPPSSPTSATTTGGSSRRTGPSAAGGSAFRPSRRWDAVLELPVELPRACGLVRRLALEGRLAVQHAQKGRPLAREPLVAGRARERLDARVPAREGVVHGRVELLLDLLGLLLREQAHGLHLRLELRALHRLEVVVARAVLDRERLALEEPLVRRAVGPVRLLPPPQLVARRLRREVRVLALELAPLVVHLPLQIRLRPRRDGLLAVLDGLDLADELHVVHLRQGEGLVVREHGRVLVLAEDAGLLLLRGQGPLRAPRARRRALVVLVDRRVALAAHRSLCWYAGA